MSKGGKGKTNATKDKEFYPPETMNQEYIDKLIVLFKNQKRLPPDCVHVILHRARAQIEKLPNLIEIQVAPEKEMTVVGDTHGQFFDLLQIFEKSQWPSAENPYLFNGDFVDRGSFGCEIFLTLSCMKLAYPNTIHMLRGNHESKQCTTEYGFKNECEDKYDFDIYLHFLHVFNALPLCALINRKIFVVHGGIPSSGNISLEELQHLNRFLEPGEEEEDAYTDELEDEYFRLGGGKQVWGRPIEDNDGSPKKMDSATKAKARQQMSPQNFNQSFTPLLSTAQREGVIMQMLWADPCEEHGTYPSLRFLGYRFGPNVTKQFLEYNGLAKVIRSHEMRPRGYQVEQDGKLITLFSCPNYCDNGNLGAYIKIKGGKPKNPAPTDTTSPISSPPAGTVTPDTPDGDKDKSPFASASASATPESPVKPRPLTISRSMSAPALPPAGSPPPSPGAVGSTSSSPSSSSGGGGTDRAASPKKPSSPPHMLGASTSASILPPLQGSGAGTASATPGGGQSASTPSITMVFHTYQGTPPPNAKKYFTMPTASVCGIM